MKKIVVLAVLACLPVTMAIAQDQERKAGPSIGEWLKGLEQKLEQIVPSKSAPVSTAVAGARGTNEDSQPRLYWKGKKVDEVVTEEELVKFKSAIVAVEKGDNTGAIKDLAEFMKQYPDSALIPDAKKTLDLVKAAGK